jgi:hypothetical protein
MLLALFLCMLPFMIAGFALALGFELPKKRKPSHKR